MPACSSAELEPGPITLLDEDKVIGPPEPPTFTPIAQEFSRQLPGFYGAFDESIALLAAESAIDVGAGIADGLGAAAHLFSSGVNAEALANLQTAEDGFRVARDKTASLKSWLPSDIQQPTGFYLLFFRVHDAADAPVVGALVQLDADFGNGATRSTDGNGVASFGVGVDVTVSYTITAPGFAIGSGVTSIHETAHWVVVTLQAAA